MKPALTTTLCILLIACNPFSFSVGPVGKALREEIREKRNMEVDLKKIISFAWDELYLFGPYTPQEEVCKQLHLTDLQCSHQVSVVSTDDVVMFLVFRHKGEIVHTEMHSRFNGDFTPLDYPQPITPQRARFLVEEERKSSRGGRWLKLRPASEATRSNNAFNTDLRVAARPSAV